MAFNRQFRLSVLRLSAVLLIVVTVLPNPAYSAHSSPKPVGTQDTVNTQPTAPERSLPSKTSGLWWDESCFTSKTVLLKMGPHLFEIPREASKNMWLKGKHIPKDPLTGMDCYREGAPPIEVTDFSFFPASDFPRMTPDANGHAPSSSLQILVHYRPDSKTVDRFQQLAKSLAKANVLLTDLPQENGFYVWRRSGPSVYIPVDPTFVARDGHLVTFGCDVQPSTRPETVSELCGTSYSDGEITYHIRLISTLGFPPSRWRELFTLTETYLDRLRVVSPNKQPSTSK